MRIELKQEDLLAPLQDFYAKKGLTVTKAVLVTEFSGETVSEGKPATQLPDFTKATCKIAIEAEFSN